MNGFYTQKKNDVVLFVGPVLVVVPLRYMAGFQLAGPAADVSKNFYGENRKSYQSPNAQYNIYLLLEEDFYHRLRRIARRVFLDHF
jgi:hypothetical protein